MNNSYFYSVFGRFTPSGNDLNFLDNVFSNTHTYHAYPSDFAQIISIFKIVKHHYDVEIIISDKVSWKFRYENFIKRTNLERVFNSCVTDISNLTVEADAYKSSNPGGTAIVLLSDSLLFEITSIYDSSDSHESISRYIDEITKHYEQIHVFSSLQVKYIFMSKSFQLS